MTDQSEKASGPLLAQDLSPAQRSLVDVMDMHQFGRIENLSVRDGQPILDSNVNVVRVARLGAESRGRQSISVKDFELKNQVRDLFERLEHFQDGTVIRVEFRQGLPFLVETTTRVIQAPEPPPLGRASPAVKRGPGRMLGPVKS